MPSSSALAGAAEWLRSGRFGPRTPRQQVHLARIGTAACATHMPHVSATCGQLRLLAGTHWPVTCTDVRAGPLTSGTADLPSWSCVEGSADVSLVRANVLYSSDPPWRGRRRRGS